jgi:type I restriction enzyme S subunit
MGRPVIATTEDYITELAVSRSAAKIVPENSVAMVVRSSILDRRFPVALVSFPVALNQDMKAVEPKEGVSSAYLAYALESNGNDILRAARKTGGSVASIDTSSLLAYEVPLPPLGVQQEIVSSLGEFSKLEAELEAELEARRKQYEHYANALLEAQDGGKRVRLGDAASVVRGASPRPIRSYVTTDSSGVHWVKIGDVPSDGRYITDTKQRITAAGAEKSRRIYPGDFVLSNSMSFGRPYISKIEGCIHDGWLGISGFEKSFTADYLYFVLRSEPVQREFARRASSGTVKNLNAEIVRNVAVPCPPLSRQEEIAGVLDGFDELVNDLSSGLPAELNARRKQYEYYRDRLLTFEEAPA